MHFGGPKYIHIVVQLSPSSVPQFVTLNWNSVAMKQ